MIINLCVVCPSMDLTVIVSIFPFLVSHCPRTPPTELVPESRAKSSRNLRTMVFTYISVSLAVWVPICPITPPMPFRSEPSVSPASADLVASVVEYSLSIQVESTPVASPPNIPPMTPPIPPSLLIT